MKQAACNEENFPPAGAWWDEFDPEIFFPKAHNHADATAKARWTCFGCPVQKECAIYRENTNSPYGIWAGEPFNMELPKAGPKGPPPAKKYEPGKIPLLPL